MNCCPGSMDYGKYKMVEKYVSEQGTGVALKTKTCLGLGILDTGYKLYA